MSEPAEAEDATATMNYDDLSVVFFVGKLHQLIEAGIDMGITRDQLQQLLMAINEIYARLVVPPKGAPH